MDNTAISEYEPFYNKYKDVCTGYIMYIKGFKKTDINSNSVSEYQKVTHTDAYFTKYGYDQAGMEKWREDEDKRVEAPAYIEKDGKRYIKEGTVIGTTTNSDIVMYLINRENSLMEDVESYIRLSDNNLDTDWAYFYWVPYESGGIDGEGNGPEAVGQTTSGELAVGIAQWTTTNKSGGVNNIPDFCKKAIELNSSLCAELRPFVGVLLEINKCKYFAPLSSPKPKHIKMKNQVDFYKIDSGKLGAINLNNMEKMEELSLQCRKILNENDGFLKVSTVSEKFPAFICNKKDRGAFIYVKCPTYTVCILKQMDRQEIESLNAMLNLTVSSELVATKRVWWNDEGQEEPFLYETTCFGKNLEENKKIKEDVERMFKNAGYRTETGVSYYILKKPIGIVNIEGEEYFALLDKFDI